MPAPFQLGEDITVNNVVMACYKPPPHQRHVCRPLEGQILEVKPPPPLSGGKAKKGDRLIGRRNSTVVSTCSGDDALMRREEMLKKVTKGKAPRWLSSSSVRPCY